LAIEWETDIPWFPFKFTPRITGSEISLRIDHQDYDLNQDPILQSVFRRKMGVSEKLIIFSIGGSIVSKLGDRWKHAILDCKGRCSRHGPRRAHRALSLICDNDVMRPGWA
jgi:hypothetical protein